MTAVSQQTIDLIRGFEGCRLEAYQDQVGVWTIGWGTTAGVRSGMSCTQQQADDWNLAAIQATQDAVETMAHVPLTPGQLSALVSFAYNLGTGALEHSTLLRKLNQGDPAGAAAEFLRWDRAGGQEVAGLLRRRQAEKAMFES